MENSAKKTNEVDEKYTLESLGTARTLNEAIRRGLCFSPAGDLNAAIDTVEMLVLDFINQKFAAGYLKTESEGELDRLESVCLQIKKRDGDE